MQAALFTSLLSYLRGLLFQFPFLPPQSPQALHTTLGTKPPCPFSFLSCVPRSSAHLAQPLRSSIYPPVLWGLTQGPGTYCALCREHFSPLYKLLFLISFRSQHRCPLPWPCFCAAFYPFKCFILIQSTYTPGHHILYFFVCSLSLLLDRQLYTRAGTVCLFWCCFQNSVVPGPYNSSSAKYVLRK